MAYSEEQKTEIINAICKEITEGMAVRDSIASKSISTTTFYSWIDNDEGKQKQYVRACEERADKIFEEILDIADHSEEDHTPFTGGNVIQRDRLKIDARKWMLSKLNPKKYGDKLEVEQQTDVTISFKD